MHFIYTTVQVRDGGSPTYHQRRPSTGSPRRVCAARRHIGGSLRTYARNTSITCLVGWRRARRSATAPTVRGAVVKMPSLAARVCLPTSYYGTSLPYG
jgi:hypothetical protein